MNTGRLRAAGLVVLALLAISNLPADTVTLSGSAEVDDATIISSHLAGNTGGDVNARVGRTALGSLRRLLLRFDLSAIPAGVTITGASVELAVTLSATATDTIHVRRLGASWVEGTGIGTGGSMGGGAGTVVPGAVCWQDREQGILAWSTLGGDFAGTDSASATAPSSGSFTLGGPGLVADVQGWVDTPSTNHGWILTGTETTTSARVIVSSEGTTGPTLTVDYTLGSTAAQDWSHYR